MAVEEHERRRIEIRAPAKINLFLAVRGLRPDGYHELTSVMQTVSLRDHLTVDIDCRSGREQHPAARRRMTLELDLAEAGSAPAGEGNLVIQAALLLGERMGRLDREHYAPGDRDRWAPLTSIRLSKAIPVAGGMAGGSSDAAATLIALNRLWKCGLGVDELQRVAAELGSDVPFCVVGGTALATGRGTAVARVLCRGTFHWVIGASGQPLSTAAVYNAWDADPCESTMEPDAVLAALSTGDAAALGGALANDLQAPAFTLRPELVAQRESLLSAGALGAVVSGSGPTMLGLAGDARDAERIAADVAAQFDQVYVASSPAGGPDVTR